MRRQFIAIVAAVIAVQSIAFGEVDRDRLERLAKQRREVIEFEVREKQAEVARLEQQLIVEKGRGAQWYFHKIAVVCGITGAAGLILLSRVGTVKNDESFLVGGLSTAVGGAICSSLASAVTMLTNSNVDLARELVEVAEKELAQLQVQQGTAK